MKNIMAGHGAPHARIEIVPLIDIMFFLLASFMLVSITMSKQQTIKVDLPSAVAGFETLIWNDGVSWRLITAALWSNWLLQ